jgi:ferric-dicitrate binding protein FerR (iron transport regulator)
LTHNYEHIEDLIAKELAGEISPDEALVLQQWLAASPANRKYFESLDKIFNESASLKDLRIVDTDAAWNKLKSKLHETKADNVVPIQAKNNYKWMLRVAAVFVFATLTFATYYFLNKDNVVSQSYAATALARLITLPDSTTVYLNKNTSVTYTYTDNKREVTLTGEAFFDVKHNEKQPFIIHAQDLEIKDIGTTFNVKSKLGSDSVEVLVTSGEVELTAYLSPDIKTNYKLLPCQQAVYNKKLKSVSKTQVTDSNALAYHTKVFVFENASLQVVAAKLNEVYGTEISVNDAIKDCHITATFKNEKVEAIVDVIAATLNLKLTKNETKYVLEGEGCDE